MVSFYCHRTEEDALHYPREELFTLSKDVWASKDQQAFIDSHSYLYYEFGYYVSD
ncbi:hypothetical protein [Pseudoalteromonas marina]|uniref:Uncharacterized protein n=1 Tax=Pseudoalteromonas marina TaxID=267375 RepID=A0ABT9FCC7_9GAMM|nr:hypothetical protein [Pseudoalteromonas marina]MDP2564290.1 hypothetical protein [Pseudoalteromonas marina]